MTNLTATQIDFIRGLGFRVLDESEGSFDVYLAPAGETVDRDGWIVDDGSRGFRRADRVVMTPKADGVWTVLTFSRGRGRVRDMPAREAWTKAKARVEAALEAGWTTH